MSIKNSKVLLSRGTAREVYKRLKTAGEVISYMGVYKRLLRESHLPTMKIAEEIEKRKEKEREDFARTKKRIRNAVTKQEEEK